MTFVENRVGLKFKITFEINKLTTKKFNLKNRIRLTKLVKKEKKR
jgi:hypothetical protein